ncbi:matrixin family metalloprotease [Candidatus Pacearchaeota archaeon]|nr:matrixin family metalloprotease [Candidatus Pacearchaeota archaeon]
MSQLIRCEARNDGNQIGFKENIEGLDEWPLAKNWPDGEVSYRLNNRSTDFLARWQRDAVVVAFRVWNWRMGRLRARRERSPDAHVDIEISFEGREEFSHDNIFAHAYYPGQGEISGDIEINDESWDWQPNVHLSDLSRPPLVPIMIHEIGHSLGLKHDTLSSSMHTEIMYPSYNMGRKQVSLGARDISRIQERYGARTLSQNVLDYFKRRRQAGWDF